MSKSTLGLCLAKGSQPNKDDFAKIMFPVKQILGIAIGIGLGHFQFTGIVAIIIYLLVSSGISYVYSNRFLEIDEDEIDSSSILTEAFGVGLACFLNLFNKLFTTASMAEDDNVPDPGFEDHMMAMEGDEEMSPINDISGDFKAPSEYRYLMMKNRGIFSMDERDKIEGFRFQFALPVAQNFIVQNRWSLVPPQQHSQNPMEMRMSGRPVPTSNYELDLYYIYGADVTRQEDLDHNKLIHFRGGLKQGGNVDAAIIKRFGNNAEMRLEGMFTPRGSQYNLAFELKSKLFINTLSLGNMEYSYSTSHLIGKRLQLGASLQYLIPKNSLDISFGGVYKYKNKFVGFGIDHMRGESFLNYVINIGKGTTIGTQIKYKFEHDKESIATIGYSKAYKGSYIKALLDSTGKIASSFVLGSPYSFVRFKTYAGGNIFGENFNFGYGLVAGGNEL